MNSHVTPESKSQSGFADLGISSQILQTLAKMNIVTPTPIQQQSIPVGLEGKDVLGIAQTGTGKTLAFGIPLVQRLDQKPGNALILLPTRELALQVQESLLPLMRVFHLQSAVLIGGVSMHGQIKDLARHPRIIIATPGRLIDLMEQGRVKLGAVNMLVLDEADRMLDMGFAPQLNQIMKTVPSLRQTMLFSATMLPAVLKLATTFMALPVHVEVAPAGTTAADIEQEIFIVRQEMKRSLLEKLLQDNPGTVLVFSRTRHGAKKIAQVLNLMGHKAAEIHSDRSQAQRKEALAGFKSGRFRILVATDIAARGIDVKGIELVVNFDLPDNLEDYVHRIGRTGRAGQKGKAVSFACPDQRQEIRGIEKLIRRSITIAPLPELELSKIPHIPFIKEQQERQRFRPKRSYSPPKRQGPKKRSGAKRPHRKRHNRPKPT